MRKYIASRDVFLGSQKPVKFNIFETELGFEVACDNNDDVIPVMSYDFTYNKWSFRLPPMIAGYYTTCGLVQLMMQTINEYYAKSCVIDYTPVFGVRVRCYTMRTGGTNKYLFVEYVDAEGKAVGRYNLSEGVINLARDHRDDVFLKSFIKDDVEEHLDMYEECARSATYFCLDSSDVRRMLM